MKKYWENLRPLERRVVFGAGALFFVVFNLVFVRPYFSEWANVQDRMFQAQRKVKMYQAEIDQKPSFERQIKALEKEGLAVPQEEQSLHFSTAVQAQAQQSKVSINSNTRMTYQTNQFFLELSQGISTQSGEQALVDFLYGLGSGNSLIRVRDLSLKTDPPRMALVANIKLVASYQKKAPVKPATTPASSRGVRTAGPAAPPAVSTAKR